MLDYVKRRIRRRLTKLACRHLGLHTDRILTVSDIGDPVDLIRRLNRTCRGIVHVGANLGQEFDSYCRDGLEAVLYIEPIPDIFEKLRARVSVAPRHIAINALCTERDGDEVDFHISTHNGAASSIFEFGSHAIHHSGVRFQSTIRMRTSTLDRILFETPGLRPELFDCLVIDVQGAEANVLRGAPRTLAQCNYVFVEVTEGDLYQGGAPFEDIIALLKEHGFRLKSLDINRFSWGNALFVKPERVAPAPAAAATPTATA